MKIVSFFKRVFLRIKKVFVRSKIYYINGSDTLPPPLEPDVEEVMIEHIGEQEARDALIEHNLRLVVYIAKRFENRNHIHG